MVNPPFEVEFLSIRFPRHSAALIRSETLRGPASAPLFLPSPKIPVESYSPMRCDAVAVIVVAVAVTNQSLDRWKASIIDEVPQRRLRLRPQQLSAEEDEQEQQEEEEEEG